MSRRFSCQLFAVLLFLCFVATPVCAVSNQGLYWGIEVGSRFDYHKTGDTVYGAGSEGEYFYVVIDSLPSIADSINTTGNLPDFPEASQFYDNGTEIQGSSGWFVRPIGNWSLFVDIWENQWSNSTEENVTQVIIDTSLRIGYNYTISWESGTDTYAEIYVRATGVLHTRYSRFIDTEHDLDFLTRISLVEETGWPFPFDSPLGIAAIGITGIAVILVVVVLLKRE
ncbi:MAG: hypothetical protein ACFFAY_01160 [Promethearchaeota archaeon]